MNATLFEMGPLPDSGLKLNEAQRRAITHGSGPLLVIAGAGTGKTRVITERIKHLLSTDASLLGENILALTFTNKAAGEMRSRVIKSTGERGEGLTIETFHSFCQGLLKEIAPDRKVLEKVDHWILLRRNMRRLKLEKYRKLAEPGQFLNDFLQFFSRCQDELVSSAEYARFAEGEAQMLESERALLDEDTYKERLEEVGKQREIARAYQSSDDLLREKNAVAINGLITDAVALLENDASKRASSAGTLQAHPGGRISGYQYRATPATGTAVRANRAISWWSATTTRPFTVFAVHRSEVSRCFSNDLRGGSRAGFRPVSRGPDRELSLDAKYSCAWPSR